MEARPNPTTETPTPPVAGNLAFIVGQLVTEPVYRTLPGGTDVATFGLTVRSDGEATTSVPLVWYKPSRRLATWPIGSTVVAVGPVVRRFYQAGGYPASRTEVSVRQAEKLTRRAGVGPIVDGFMNRAADLAAAVTGTR